MAGRRQARFNLLVLTVILAGLAACSAGSGSSRGGRPGEALLVGIGASDAAGVGASDPLTKNWVAQLAAHFPGRMRMVNLGISGATAAQAAQQELPVALDAGPTVVAIWLGVNDIQQSVPLEAFSATLTEILSDLHQQTGVTVLVANLPDLSTLPAFQSSPAGSLQQTTDEWNAAIAGDAAAQHASLVDLHAAWAALPNRASLISPDGLHPNDAGYRELADLFWQALKGGR